MRHVNPKLPAEFVGFYDQEKYEKSQKYLRENTLTGLVQTTIQTPILILFVILGGFNFVDNLSRGLGFSEISTGIIFIGILMVGNQLMELPFSIYDTFVIEEKYGFNKTTVKTFIFDLSKGLVLVALLGSGLFASVVWFFQSAGEFAWLYAWLFLSLIQFIFMFLAPVIIMPLFNKFTPLEDGELRRAIEGYAQSQNFNLSGIFTMDGSKRSTKSNAYFTGFGKFRRIVLFDTLIEGHSVDELLAILAHEMGHFKKKHIIKLTLISIISSGIMFYLLSLFMKNSELFAAFKMDHISVYASIVFFGFLYTPISMFLSILVNYLSRKFEFEADQYAVDTHGKKRATIIWLKNP